MHLVRQLAIALLLGTILAPSSWAQSDEPQADAAPSEEAQADEEQADKASSEEAQTTDKEEQASENQADDASPEEAQVNETQPEATPTSVFNDVTEQARELASSSYESRSGALPEALRELDHNVYESIRFRPESALWKGEELFSVQLFHSGFLYNQPVSIHLVKDGKIDPLSFSKDFFQYEGDAAPLAERDLSNAGFAGFRLHYPINRENYHDEFLVFRGASYFRMVGRHQRYGLSARGLAINTATPEGEEFPAFREFWLFKPGPDDTSMNVVALLDSPSVAGAYLFTIRPGERVTVDVEARLFARQDIDKLGIAPLTSMFGHGDASLFPADDFRPRAHDSGGLLTRTSSKEWVWRPLNNPRELRISRFQDETPSQFGLVQRKRDFEDYLDAKRRYDRRPSYWVMPLDDWGPGSVELVEIPSDSETNDNIVAYWVPKRSMQAGDERTYRYQISTFDAHLPQQTLASVVRTRQGWAREPGQVEPPPRTQRQFVVDFQGGDLSTLDASHPVEADLSASNGEIRNLEVQQLPDGRTWRASFHLQPEGQQPVDMRLRLSMRGKPVTETWNYVWTPNELR
ncbi:hypothetical protein L861_10035 [Litchfieldella anticariensis FP35 = DSM 16096]|uniref:Glucan biosynthesis periplasmic MdoG C-terminal domain-containing protein n=1 Tax=Litchfieldella anticariensis (strain DSM 16096 / CECT 5854 / CIP 108499 / LMG 22089 / FP35) TaxID=1121939 RepID=S2L4M1_LITA3|nr:glucan biosynthesis protein [Halomonas anticariensis]EPC02674.1 hypothetical protein L861_10035 [Halomonas anticariensis FP35 = DSM 16096]